MKLQIPTLFRDSLFFLVYQAKVISKKSIVMTDLGVERLYASLWNNSQPFSHLTKVHTSFI